jgi:Protein of unknown function (DUF4242)
MAARPPHRRRAAKTYLVEHYEPRIGANELVRVARRARAAAERMAGAGVPVRLLHSLYVPEDESWFLVYEAASAEAVTEAAHEAAIVVERVVEALQIQASAPYRDAETESVTS